MNTHDHSAKKQVNTLLTQPAHEEPIADDVSGLSNFFAIQRVNQKPNQKILTPDMVLQLQRTIGNRATRRHLLETPRKANVQVTPRIESQIQRKQVQVSGGVFDDKGHPDGYVKYEDEVTKAGGKRYLERGAKMSGLKFTPNKNLVNASGELATEVSLVQTTNSTVKDVQDPDKKDQPHSMLNERRTKAGSAIDQEIFHLPDSKGYLGSTKWKSDVLAQAITEIEVGYVDHKSDDGTVINLYKDNRTPWSQILARHRQSFEDGGNRDKNQDATAAQIRLMKSDMEKFIEKQQGIITWFTGTATMSDAELREAGAPERWIKGRNEIPVQVQQTIDRVNGGILPVLEAMLDEAEVDKNQKMYKDARINLDPRYHEDRRTEEDPLKQTGTSDIDFKQTTGWPAHREKGEDDWAGDAMLRDRPAHEFKPEHQLQGAEHFETAAMADGDKFVGSVRWGWRIDGQDPILDPAEIELVNYGEASDDFYEAAGKWNEMTVQDPGDPNMQHNTIGLPTKDTGVLAGSISLLDKQLGSSNSFNIAPKSDKEQLSNLKDEIMRIWPTIPKDFRARYRSKLLDVMDRYVMKIDRRRPSQSALIDEFGIDD